MPLYNRLPENITEVDIIIAGGGTAGCVVAGRLAEHDPKLSILVIEYGKDNYDVPSVVYPALYPLNIAEGSDTRILYKTEASLQLNGRAPLFATGGVLGGGSSINFMMYTRAQRDDFDSWKTEGWSTDDMIPYLKKLETYHIRGDPKVHGFSGPVHVSDGGFTCHSAKDDFLEAARRIGYPNVTDLQDLDSNNGFGTWYRNVSPDGRRQDSAHTYLHPLLRDGKHPNLHVLTETKVTSILTDKNHIPAGVVFSTIPMESRNLPTNQGHQHVQNIVSARKLIVLSCGAIATPLLLERSGFGDANIITGLGSQLSVNLPGVGENYNDHNAVFYTYKVDLPPQYTLEEVLKSEESVRRAIANKSHLLGWNGIDICSKFRPSEDEVEALGVQFKRAWDRDYKNKPNRPLMLMCPILFKSGDKSTLTEGSAITIVTYSAYPYSRGTIHNTSIDPYAPPLFCSGYFTDDGDFDLKMLVWAYKKSREFMRRTKMYRGEIAADHPKFNHGSKAACVELPVDREFDINTVSDIIYTAEDDKAIEDFVRDKVTTPWHALGTAKMAPREDNGVVDKNLNVYGTKKLKVIDLSIAPENVGANTCNTAMVIGEKGADIIIKELKESAASA